MCAEGSRSRAGPSGPVPQGSCWWCCSEVGDEIQGTDLPHQANESCVPACPAPCLVIYIPNQPRESLLRQGQEAFREMLCNYKGLK